MLSNSQAGPGRNFSQPRDHLLVNPCTRLRDPLYRVHQSISIVIVLTSLQVFDFADIIGSVGGSLGLFLGFSCLALAQALLRRF